MEQLVKRAGIPKLYVYYEKDQLYFPVLQYQCSLAIDCVPTLDVVITGGRVLNNIEANRETISFDHIPVSSLYELQRAVTDRKRGFIRCALFNTYPDEDILVFPGYIETAVFAVDPTAGQLTLELSCSNRAGKLMGPKQGTFVNATLNTIIDKLEGGTDLDDAVNEQKTNTGDSIIDFKEAFVAQCVKEDIKNLATICATAVAYVRLANTLDAEVPDRLDPDPAFFDILGGTARIAALEKDLFETYLEVFFTNLQNAWTSLSPLQALQHTLETAGVRLHLVPAPSVDTQNDYRFRVVPSRAWEPEAALTLDSSVLVGIRSAVSIRESLQSPDVQLVEFNEAYSYTQGTSTSDHLLDTVGVYSPDPELDTELRRAILDESFKLEDVDRTYNVAIDRAPEWLLGALGSDSASTAEEAGRNNKKSLDEEKSPPTDKDRKDTEPIKIKETADSALFQAACDIAHTLLLDKYGSGLSAAVDLVPNLYRGSDPDRFLEDSIGRPVTIRTKLPLAESSEGALNLTGELVSVTLSGSFSGESPRLQYTIRLNKVRYTNEGMPTGISPLYALS